MTTSIGWTFFFFFIRSTVCEHKTQRLSTSASFKGSEKECGASSGSGSSGFRAMSPPVRLSCYMRNCSKCVCLAAYFGRAWEVRSPLGPLCLTEKENLSYKYCWGTSAFLYLSFSCIQLNQLRKGFFPFPPLLFPLPSIIFSLIKTLWINFMPYKCCLPSWVWNICS